MRANLGHFLRAGLLGFVTLFVVAALTAADKSQESRKRFLKQQQELAAKAGTPFDAERQEPELMARFRKKQLAELTGAGLFGAILTMLTMGILRLLFPVGPASKIVIGAVCGPFLPILITAPKQISNGNGGDVAGVVVLGMILGALAGLLEANRIRPPSRQRGFTATEP